jgi:hypothetical protein
VVSHQAVSAHRNGAQRTPLGHHLSVCPIVIVQEKGLLTTTALLGYVMGYARSHYSCHSCHERIRSQVGSYLQEKSIVSPELDLILYP